MNRLLLSTIVVALSQTSIHAGEADKRLAELLQPNIPFSPLPGRPAAFREPRPILHVLALAKFQEAPPRPGIVAARPVMPHSPQEPLPLDIAGPVMPRAPRGVTLPTADVVAIPSVDPAVPPPLPIFARPLADRAPLSDATLEASFAAALARAIPLRSLPIPFTVMNLPDPFELQNLIRLQAPPAEDALPMTIPPRVLVRPMPK